MKATRIIRVAFFVSDTNGWTAVHRIVMAAQSCPKDGVASLRHSRSRIQAGLRSLRKLGCVRLSGIQIKN
jgi:hypothetical protein